MAKFSWSRFLLNAARGAADTVLRPRPSGGSSGPRKDSGSRRTTSSSPPRTTTSSSSRTTSSGSASSTGPSAPGATYPGDFAATVRPVYSPILDGEADPGEIVWTWVPYEEDYSKGKDRPVLVVGRDGSWLLALMLSSKDHVSPGQLEGPGGARWLDIGSGPWDPQGRDSEIRLDRVLRVDPASVRREGAIMDKTTFDRVASFLT